MSNVRSLPPAITLTVLIATQVVFQTPAGADPGDLDTTFGVGGRVIAGCDVWDDEYFGCDGGYGGRLYAVAVQADGGIVAAGAQEIGGGGKTAFGVVRQLEDGALDPSFGGTGEVTTTFAARSAAYALALQDDGRIVVAGAAGRTLRPESFSMAGAPGNSFALARYTVDGALDPSFGADGKVRTRFGHSPAAAYAVAIQPDGEVIAVGQAGRAFALARYTPDGSPDATFGSDGRIRTRFVPTAERGSASDIELLQDGAILVSGTTCSLDGCMLVLARYLSEGTLDPAFGTGGVVLTPVRQYSLVDMVVQTDSRIVVGTGHLLLRFDAEGALDESFSVDGWVRTGVAAGGIGVQSSGAIVVTGPTKSEPWSFNTVRFDASGERDTSFGLAVADFPGFDSVAYALAIQADDKVVAVGTTSDVNIDGRFALARFLAD